MRRLGRREPWWQVLGLTLLASCGSASIGGGIAGTSSVVGAISGFGSIIVAGIELDVSRAAVTIDGDPASASDLELGMVAVVRGTVDRRLARGVAESVSVENLADGPVEAVDAAGSTLTVLGQEVIADAATVFDPVPLEDLEPGDFVGVSGFVDAGGRIRATRVERSPAPSEIALIGTVAGLDLAAMTFRIGGLTIDFSAAVIEGASGGRLEDGLLVDVDAESPPAAGVLAATVVDVIDPTLATQPGEGLDVEGFVTEIVSESEVVLSGAQRVRITSETRFEGGDRSDLVLDAHVEAEGAADADGALVASEVEFLRR